ncbi:hypothetical protein KORDIASMS9_04293 [Kordia sp. SMS9]|uniref:hypothetical protein n=1 Tax=Kordia sp. SMS9 TaxID=2282170 RepID=UPI000E0DEB88|nr:hypothetical protein [Kordia sp. SMS9]AXG72031.1 hypothetical protein KORDIASMS9_04293 [Kordia sp. SMS9]
MKEKDNITNLFDRLQDDFDIETPQLGHEHRFLKKLQQPPAQEITETKQPNALFTWWKQIAAACVVLLSLGILIGSNVDFGASAEETQITFSPEVEKSQLYFASLIEKELEKVKAAEDEDTKEIIQDAMKRLERLENDYETLKNQLVENGDDKRILHAMITNFQLRIELLESVLQQIDEIKLFKNEQTII